MRISMWIDRNEADRPGTTDFESDVTSGLSRFSEKIAEVDVRLRDVNGEKGGIDKQCRVTLHLTDGDVITVSEKDSQYGAALNRSLERLRTTLARKLERNRDQRSSVTMSGDSRS